MQQSKKHDAQSALIIDGAYLHERAKELKKRLDMQALKRLIEAECDTTFAECHYITSMPRHIGADYSQYINWLSMREPKGPHMMVHPYQLKERHQQCQKCGHDELRFVQKGVDVAIAIKLILLATKYHHVAVLAGDADFAPAFTFIKTDPSRKLTLCTFGGCYSRDLSMLSDKVIFLDHHGGQFLKKAG